MSTRTIMLVRAVSMLTLATAGIAPLLGGCLEPGPASEVTDSDEATIELASFRQVCRDLSWGTVCVSYNFDSRTAAANVQNLMLGPWAVELKLLDRPLGSVLERWSGAMAKGQWKGIFRSGVNDGQYCGVANGSAICLP